MPCAAPAVAQTVSYSQEQKFSVRSHHAEVIGKTGDLIYTHVASRDGSEIIAFRHNMAKHWRRPLIPEQDAQVKAVFLRDSSFHVAYTTRKKNILSLEIKRFMLDLTPDTQHIVVDTQALGLGQGQPEYRFQLSADKSKMVVRWLTRRSGKGDVFLYKILDNQLRVIDQGKAELPTASKRVGFHTGFVDNEGEQFIVITESKGQVGVPAKFWILRSSESFVPKDSFSFGVEERWLNNLVFEPDNQNRNIVVTGFYSTDPKRPTTAEGVFFATFDLLTDRRIGAAFEPFPPEFIAKIKGTRQSRATERLYSFVIDDIILRSDGGAIIVAESYQKAIRARGNPTVADSYGPYSLGESTTTYYFEELMVLSMSTEGEIDWKNVLIKSQVSSGDNGRFSSYVAMNTGRKISFIFNDEIKYRTNVVQYIVTPDGDVEREIMFNARNHDLYLMPQLGRQVSAYEMVIPSFKKGKLRFVKLAY